ncbi:MAG TPA: THUMP domain-containing protein [Bacteroidales bacterium]|nr:THUMP domain-containing protein [Bacteroidales bacterium]
MKIVAKTLYGLEEVLADELTALGAIKAKAGNRAVVFEGNKSLLYRVNYCSRLALSFMVPVNEYTIRKPSDLYDGAFNLPWDNYLDASQTFAITSVVTSKHFTHSGYPALVVKDAIADYFRRRTSKRPNVDSRSPDIQINLHISHDRVTISLDSTVVPLFKRGYREEQGVAPLNEVLAAGIIALSGWKADTPLTDGMCGSGTIVAEAGLMACNIAPGYFRRNFGFMKWKDFDESLFRSIKFDAEKKVRKSPVPIFGKDISEEAVRIARSNITGCGLNDTIQISQADFLSSVPETETGTIIMNPPYGQRIGLFDQNAFYREVGSRLKHFYTGHKAWILSGDRECLQAVGLKTYKKFDLYNGNIECRLHGYDLYQGTKKTKPEN